MTGPGRVWRTSEGVPQPAPVPAPVRKDGEKPPREERNG